MAWLRRANYKNYEAGQSKPPLHVQRKIEILDQATGQAKPDDVGAPAIPMSLIYAPVPYIGLVSASDHTLWADPNDTDAMEFVPSEMAESRGRFACRIESDSMMPLLEPEDVCVFQQDMVPKIGRVVLYRANDNKITVKQLKHDGASYLLHALNPRVTDVEATGVQVGYLVGIVRRIGRRVKTDYDPDGIRP